MPDKEDVSKAAEAAAKAMRGERVKGFTSPINEKAEAEMRARNREENKRARADAEDLAEDSIANKASGAYREEQNKRADEYEKRGESGRAEKIRETVREFHRETVKPIVLGGSGKSNPRAQATELLSKTNKPKDTTQPNGPKTGANSRLKAVQLAASRVPNDSGGFEWVPDPQLVIVLGGGLVLLSWLSTGANQTSAVASALQRILLKPSDYQKAAKSTASTTVNSWWKLWGEVVFVFILYILANISDELSRIVVIFLMLLYLLLLVFQGPSIISAIANLPGTVHKVSK